MDPRLPQLDYANAEKAAEWKETQAARADVLKCYEEAVQEPMLECTNLDSFYCGAQQEDSLVQEARLLREDFCSTAIVARTWLNLHEENLSQGVDIDLDALRDTRRRVFREGKEVCEKLRLKIVQSPAFAKSRFGAEVPEGDAEVASKEIAQAQASECATDNEDRDTKTGSSWSTGAASERFERRHQARLTNLAKGNEKGKRNAASSTGTPTKAASRESRFMLLHSDVLDLPFSYTIGTAPKADESHSTVERRVEAPDMIAALNYALCYFHSRAALLAYLRVCLRTLKPKTGVLVCDLFGGPPTGETYPDQECIWRKFEQEPGFQREGDRIRTAEAGGDAGALRPLWNSERSHRKLPSVAQDRKPDGLADEHEILEDFGEVRVVPPPPDAHLNTCAEWPKGMLKLVRAGEASGGFEYWREDGPIDYRTNRFRMSLSFRFRDCSWLRDVFSYDFRIWSLAEILEAMEEVGFVRVKAHVVPRNVSDTQSSGSRSRSSSMSSVSDQADSSGDDGFMHMSDLMKRTEREEAARNNYTAVGNGGKVFATGSFSTYIVACAP